MRVEGEGEGGQRAGVGGTATGYGLRGGGGRGKSEREGKADTAVDSRVRLQTLLDLRHPASMPLIVHTQLCSSR